MVGMAVETMVWSREESIMPAISAEKMIQMRRCVSSNGAGPGGVGGAVVVAMVVPCVWWERCVEGAGSGRGRLWLVHQLLAEQLPGLVHDGEELLLQGGTA